MKSMSRDRLSGSPKALLSLLRNSSIFSSDFSSSGSARPVLERMKADAGGSTDGLPGWARAALASAPKQPAAADADPADAATGGGGGAAVDSLERQRLAWRREAEEGARALALIQASIAKAERMRGELRAGVDAVRRGEGLSLIHI